jgi:hypothetical protein
MLYEPQSILSAQYSLPFTVALLLLRGKDGLVHLDEGMLVDDDIRRLARRVAFSEMNGPNSHAMSDGGKVVLETDAGSRTYLAPGMSVRSSDDLVRLSREKFRDFSSDRLLRHEADQLEDLVGRIDKLDAVSTVGQYLSRSARRAQETREQKEG